nr:hypothetical protein [Tanacetum cinerariifolium]
MALTFADTHNMIAYLTKSDASEGFDQIIGATDVDVDDVPAAVEPSIPSPTTTTQPPPPSQDLPSTSQVIPTPPPSPLAQPPSPQQQPQPTQPSYDDKIAQTLEITKLKQRVTKLEKRNKFKVSKLRRLKNVGTSQKVDTSEDTIMDDVSKQGEIIATIDVNEDVTLKEVVVEKDAKIEDNADAQGRQADATNTATTTLIIAAIMTAALSAARRRKGVVIIDLEETYAPSIIIHTKPKSKDKGKWIWLNVTAVSLIKKVNDVSKLQSIVDRKKVIITEATIRDALHLDYAKGIECLPNEEIFIELARIGSDVQGRQAESQAQIYQINLEHADKVLSMQDVDIKPAELQEVVEVVTTAKLITEVVTSARMKYDDIRPIFEIYFNSNVDFLEKTNEKIEDEDSRALTRISESKEEKAAKKQKLDEEVAELKRHLQIVPNDDDDVYTEATPLARKVHVVDYDIYTENNKPYYKIIRADGSS